MILFRFSYTCKFVRFIGSWIFYLHDDKMNKNGHLFPRGGGHSHMEVTGYVRPRPPK